MRSTNHGSRTNTGALTIRVGFWDIFYYNYNKEPPKQYRQFFVDPHINP